MGVLSSFFQKFQKNGWTGQVDAELDPIRSEYPRLMVSGYWASSGRSSIITVPSMKLFDMKTLIFENYDSIAQHVALFDGAGTSVPVFGIPVAKSAAEVITGLQGILFASTVFASTTDSLSRVRVGGLLVESV